MSSIDSKVQCKECKSVFAKKKNLYAHLRKFHNEPNIAIAEKKPKLKCVTCSKLFSCKYTLQRHVNRSHIDKNDQKNKQKACRILCPQDNCSEKFPNYRNLRDHLITKHSVEIEIEIVEFNSVEDFQKWKEGVQQQSLSLYTLDTAPKQLSADVQKQYFNCHRSYTYKAHGKNIRCLKSMGSNKIGKACPSRMEVTIITTECTKKTVKVLFWKTHFGHDIQLGHTILDKQSRDEIADKLKEGVSFDHILDCVRDNESNQRLALLGRKDLHNIIRDYNIDYNSTKRYQNAAVGANLGVEEALKEEDFDTLDLGYNDNGEINSITSSDTNEVNNLLDVCHSSAIPKIHCNKKIKEKAKLIIDLNDTVSISEENSTKIENYLDKAISILNVNDPI